MPNISNLVALAVPEQDDRLRQGRELDLGKRAKGTGFFAAVDKLVKKTRKELAATREALKALGWRLRPVSTAGMWRARRWSKKKKTERLYAPTSEELIALATAEHASRARPKKSAEESDP